MASWVQITPGAVQTLQNRSVAPPTRLSVIPSKSKLHPSPLLTLPPEARLHAVVNQSEFCTPSSGSVIYSNHRHVFSPCQHSVSASVNIQPPQPEQSRVITREVHENTNLQPSPLIGRCGLTQFSSHEPFHFSPPSITHIRNTRGVKPIQVFYAAPSQKLVQPRHLKSSQRIALPQRTRTYSRIAFSELHDNSNRIVEPIAQEKPTKVIETKQDFLKHARETLSFMDTIGVRSGTQKLLSQSRVILKHPFDKEMDISGKLDKSLLVS